MRHPLQDEIEERIRCFKSNCVYIRNGDEKWCTVRADYELMSKIIDDIYRLVCITNKLDMPEEKKEAMGYEQSGRKP